MAAVAPQPAAPPRATVEVVSLLDDDDDEQCAPSGRAAGPSRPQPSQQRRQQQQQRRRQRPAENGGSAEVIDLTSDSQPDADTEVQVVRSTVVPRGPMRGAKRPRLSPAQQRAQQQPAQQPQQPPQLSPQKQRLLEQLRAAAAAQPEPEGPKCGICMEAMGGAGGRPMASGNCGHVYCHECLVEAVRAQKKCPTCRKGMQLRQIHKVFLSFT